MNCVSNENEREELIEMLQKCTDIRVGEQFYIWGAGNTTDLNYDVIVSEELVPCAFVDSGKKGKLHNVDIISPSEILNSDVNTIIISSAVPQTIQAIKEQIQSISSKIRCCTIDEIVLGRHIDEVVKAYDTLSTDLSKKKYFEIVKARISGTSIPEEVITSNQYFCLSPFKMRNKNEIFVDCGAYVGDSLEQYLFCKSGIFRKVVVIEPDERNIEALERRVDRLRGEWCTGDSSIEIICGAIGKDKGEIGIDCSIDSLSTKISDCDSENKVKMYTIDDLFATERVGFIKADIEGYEMDMLDGARESIIKNHPLLAICIYHRTSDLYNIPLMIKQMSNEYKLEIAHHYYDYNETVLYAY